MASEEHDDDKSTTISRRQIVGTAAIGAAGIAGGLSLGRGLVPEPAAAQTKAAPAR